MFSLTNPLLVNKKTRAKEVLGFSKQLPNPVGKKGELKNALSCPGVTPHTLPLSLSSPYP
jgi:hypothetical protein